MDRQIGAFEILTDPETGKGLHKLGEGTFGVTYKARHRLGHEVALKILKFDERDPKSERFENEAKVLYSLRHPHIASFLHYDVHKGFPYCCMEFCGGGNLLDISRERQGLPAGIALIIGRQVCSALAYAHSRPSGAIVHRDIKPENLMLGQTEGEIVVKVIDFGLAKVFGEEAEEERSLMRSAEGFKGTSLFASPEQWREGEIDGRADLYSLGMTLWYLAIGSKPAIFEGKGLGGISAIHLSNDPFDLTALDPALQPVLGRLLAKEPSQRFADAEAAEAAFHDALAEWDGARDLSLADYVRNAAPSQPLVAPLLRSERSFGESGYVVVGKWWDSSLGPVYGGKDPGGEDVALLVLEPGPQSQLSEFERHALYQRATQLRQFSAAGNLPASLIAVRGFQWFADSVSLIEMDPFWAVPLLEVIRRRRKFSFPESLHLLQHLAAGVDFMKEHGLPMPDLTDSRVFLALADPEAFGRAETFIEEDLANWPRFVVKVLPLGSGASGDSDLSDEGLDPTATLDVSEDNAWSNELSRFAAKIYSLVGGHQVAQAAYFTPGVYAEIAGLSADGNAILQSVIAATGSEYQSASCRELLLSLCRAEGVSPPQLLAEGTLVTNDVFRTSRRGPYPMPGLFTVDDSIYRTFSFGEFALDSSGARTSAKAIKEIETGGGRGRPAGLLVALAVGGIVLVVSLLGFVGWWTFLRHSPAELAGGSRPELPVPAAPPTPYPPGSGMPSAGKGTLVVPETFGAIQEAIAKEVVEGVIIQMLIAIEQDLDKQGKKIDWKRHFKDVASGFDAPSGIADAHACVLIGFKLSDAILALKGADAEAFNDCVAIIEKLAVDMDVPKDALNLACSVKSAIDRNDWHSAFLQISMMRWHIGRQVEGINNMDRGRGVLMVCGAWMQAARVALNLISENEMPPSATNYLRAPTFVALMETELNAISDPVLVNSPQVIELKKVVPRIKELVSIDRNPEIPEGQISEKDLEELRNIAGNFFLHQLGTQ